MNKTSSKKVNSTKKSEAIQPVKSLNSKRVTVQHSTLPVKKNASIVKIPPQKGLQTKVNNSEGLVSDIISTGIDIADTISTTMTNPIEGLLKKLPNTVIKSIDTINGIQRAFDPTKDGTKIIDVQKGPVVDGSKSEKIIDILKKDIPVISTTLIPQAYASEVKVPPLTQTSVTVKGVPALRVSGSVMVDRAYWNFGGGGGNVRPCGRHLLNPHQANFGPQIVAISNMYTKFQPISFNLSYSPFCPSTEIGSIVLTYQNTANTTYTPTTDINTLSQREHIVIGPLTRPLSFDLKGILTQKYVYPDSTMDTRWIADWTFEHWVGGRDASSPSGVFGWIIATYDFLFYSRTEDPAINKIPKYFSALGVQIGFDLVQTQSLLKIVSEKIREYSKESLKLLSTIGSEDEFILDPDEKTALSYVKLSNQLTKYVNHDFSTENLRELENFLIYTTKMKDTPRNRAIVYQIICYLIVQSDYIHLLQFSKMGKEDNPISLFLDVVNTIIDKHFHPDPYDPWENIF